jgi:3-methyladenine DNA glycosylase AlkC
MADLFKNIFSSELFEHVGNALSSLNSNFDEVEFRTQIYDFGWDKMEFKERMHHIAIVLRSHLSDDYGDCVNELYLMIDYFKNTSADKIKFSELAFVFIPDLIEKYGIDDFEVSVAAFENITPFTTCEYAVRPFIIKNEDRMLTKVLEWTKHKDENVRRLASEGSRPRLPWGIAIQSFKNNPEPIIPILEALKNDSSEYVRKSVANSLNDISKDNPQIVIDIAKRWKGKSKETDWIVKHACRTLLKAGNVEVLQLFGFCAPDNIVVNELTLQADIISIGDDLEFSFELHNQSLKKENIRLEYAIYYFKKNGTLSKKVYKISEKVYAPKSITIISRRQSFKLITTRKFHAGKHIVSIIINGIEVRKRTFELNES